MPTPAVQVKTKGRGVVIGVDPMHIAPFAGKEEGLVEGECMIRVRLTFRRPQYMLIAGDLQPWSSPEKQLPWQC